MNRHKLNVILSQINELKALFIFGQRVIPFLEDLFRFVKEVIPLMEEMNSSLQESTVEMPQASSQLDKVTRATELATTEILDIIDVMLVKLGEMKAGCRQVNDDIERLNHIDSRISQRLNSTLGNEYPDLLDKISILFNEKYSIYNQLSSNVERLVNGLDEVHTNTSSIMMSLQVQDITAQQIAAVTHVIQSIEYRLENLLKTYNRGSDEFGPSGFSQTDRSFDPNAIYENSHHRQQRANEIFDNASLHQSRVTDVAHKEAHSPNENHNGESQPSNEKTTDNKTVVIGKRLDNIASQDEIDKLFEG